MGLLELERVSKRYRRRVEHVALDDVSFVVDAGEMVAVWGGRQSGRSTLLRLSTGIEPPDTGVVRFEGRDLAERDGERLGCGISYCRTTFRSSAGYTIADQLAAGQYARGVQQSLARAGAWNALERVAAEQCATRVSAELDGEETIRVAIARALTSKPRLLVIDEPTIGVDIRARDSVLSLLRSIAQDGVAILMSAGEGTELRGADRVLSLHKGKLRGERTPDLASITDLSHRRQTSG